MTFKEALGIEYNDKCNFLAGLGFSSKEPINVNGQMVSPTALLLALAQNQAAETKRAPDIRHGGEPSFGSEGWQESGIQHTAMAF